jgi:toxin ParE1/3/4
MRLMIWSGSSNISAKITRLQRVARTALQQIASLKEFPQLGRPGRVNGTSELPLSPLPFIVVYRLKEQWIEIARVLHGAQRWP